VNFSPWIVIHNNTVNIYVQSLTFFELHLHEQHLLSSVNVVISVENDWITVTKIQPVTFLEHTSPSTSAKTPTTSEFEYAGFAINVSEVQHSGYSGNPYYDAHIKTSDNDLKKVRITMNSNPGVIWQLFIDKQENSQSVKLTNLIMGILELHSTMLSKVVSLRMVPIW